MSDRLSKVMSSFAGKRVLVVGDFVLSGIVSGDADRISPEAPVPVLRVVGAEYRPGGAGSVAANLTTLGAQAICCGTIGADEPGEKLLPLLRQCGADVTGMVQSEAVSTGVQTRYVGLAQHRHAQQLMRVDEGGEALPNALQTELADRAESMLEASDVVCLVGGGCEPMAASTMIRLIETSKRRNAAVVVDGGGDGDFARYRGATVLIANRGEFRSATGHREIEAETFREPAQTLHQTLGLDGLVVTLDREGALVVDEGGEVHHVPTRLRMVYDNAGAGEAMVAMISAAMAGGASLTDAVRLANIAGGLAVERFGSIPVARAEVSAELRMQTEKHTKVRTHAQLLEDVALRRGRGERIVFTNGCFDLLHYGHQQMLVRCKELGDALIVAINSDRSVRMNKGPDRPICDETERANMLAALECVDLVTIFDTETPLELIQAIRPDVLAKGGDYAGGWVCGREFVEAEGGQVVVVPFFKGYSTTSLVERIRGEDAGEGKQ